MPYAVVVLKLYNFKSCFIVEDGVQLSNLPSDHPLIRHTRLFTNVIDLVVSLNET